jgi:hypothetical protein
MTSLLTDEFIRIYNSTFLIAEIWNLQQKPWLLTALNNRNQ